jgi:hypothetical protein
VTDRALATPHHVSPPHHLQFGVATHPVVASSRTPVAEAVPPSPHHRAIAAPNLLLRPEMPPNPNSALSPHHVARLFAMLTTAMSCRSPLCRASSPLSVGQPTVGGRSCDHAPERNDTKLLIAEPVLSKIFIVGPNFSTHSYGDQLPSFPIFQSWFFLEKLY